MEKQKPSFLWQKKSTFLLLELTYPCLQRLVCMLGLREAWMLNKKAILLPSASTLYFSMHVQSISKQFFFFSFLSCQKVVLSLQQHFSYLWNISTLIRPGMAGQQFPEPIVGRHWCDSMSLAYSLNFKAYWEASFMNCVERFMWPVKTIYKIPILKGKLKVKVMGRLCSWICKRWTT